MYYSRYDKNPRVFFLKVRNNTFFPTYCFLSHEAMFVKSFPNDIWLLPLHIPIPNVVETFLLSKKHFEYDDHNFFSIKLHHA